MIYLEEILKKVRYRTFLGDEKTIITDIISFNPQNEISGAIMWVNEKKFPQAGTLKLGTLICSQIPEPLSSNCNYIIVDNPRRTFREILQKFFSLPPKLGIATTSRIAESVKIGERVFIGENVIIEDYCIIGNDVSIGHNSVILAGTIVNNKVKIGCNCTIGGIGFGYDKDTDGDYLLIPHLGNVVLCENVEIGNNTCIDRAVLGSTHLAENVKVDNLVHIAHGVQIGRNSLIIADAMIGGSAVIGENVWIAPSSSIINKGSLGNNSLVGMGAVVIKPVNEKEVVVGNPAKVLRKEK
jgi:UDP-3-O-[3-hydroxymyristoyl] glucosamine N-acyltransferase